MSDQLQKISLSLQHKIAAQIKQKGTISFAEFMRMALYEPGLGYYSAGLHKLGAAGDFVTSSQLGQLFARCHATFFATVLPDLKAPIVLELGAGTGQFCVDVLLTLDQLGVLPEQYLIMEVSADLQQVQHQAVAQLPTHLAALVSWVSSPPTASFEGIVYANEVLDALPVEVFKFEQEYQRLMLSNQQGELTETWAPFPADLAQQLMAKGLALKAGYRSEFIPHLAPWIESIVQPLKRGLLMLVDYGYGRSQYYHPERSQGTLVCHRRHQANFNPYQHIGLQDITAFVDFTAVAEAADQAGLEVAGFNSQADFLLATGIDQWVTEDGGFESYFKLATEMKKLMLPDEMGEKFKCLAAVKDLAPELAAFKNNRLHEL